MNRRPFNSGCCLWLVGLVLATTAAGCSRRHYLVRADRESYATLHQKTWRQPWAPPADFTIQPQPGSRFFDPTPPVDPALPIPAPQLYAYNLPPLPERDASRFRPEVSLPQPGLLPAPQPQGEYSLANTTARPQVKPSLPPIKQAGFSGRAASTIAKPAAHANQPAGDTADKPSESTEKPQPNDDGEPEAIPPPDNELLGVTTPKPIPIDIWQSIPPQCRRRILEFDSMQLEYQRSFQSPPSAAMLDSAERLALEDILLLSLQNSREYQRRKEILYSTALRLTLQRFDYDLKFAPFGNGTDVDFTHNRFAGTTVNSLNVPTRLNANKMLATGGNFVARFANDVLLTFRGPQGFSQNVSSELLFGLSQSVLQRDIQLEALTQSERNVVYAARDFARFRKTFFRDLAGRYYNLLLTYRQIEINTLDYFTNLRAFLQGNAEFRVGRRSRIQVDQVEQTALSSRSSLIRTCNSLESGLDNLKLVIGLPTETPLNLDLTELEQLTIRDEATVRAELVRRSARSLRQDRATSEPPRETLVNGAINLIRRMLEFSESRKRLGESGEQTDQYTVLLSRLLADEAGILVRFNRETLETDRTSMPPATPLRIFERTTDAIDSILQLSKRDLDLAQRLGRDAVVRNRLAEQLKSQGIRFKELRNSLKEVVETRQLVEIPNLIVRADALLVDADRLVSEAEQLTGRSGLTDQQLRQITLRQVDALIVQSTRMLSEQSLDLAEIQIDVDDAMLTAIVRRFDLMNQRGVLADVWRQIKLAGDDLRTVLNLNATQIIRTQAGLNRPFAFTFDDSQTQLGMSIDTPLNRKAQRNAFRQSLINYQVALRALIQLEDQTKLDVRDDLRDLQVDREQYRISVASAALASERVTSTRLQLQQNYPGVAARDFLEAQRAYTNSLSSVANQHIGYILDRIDLFLDLETLEVDASGMWPDLYDELLQPTPHFQFPGCSHVYGHLPRRVWHSKRIRRMYAVPPGAAVILNSEDEDKHDSDSAGRDATTDGQSPDRAAAPPNPVGEAKNVEPLPSGGTGPPGQGRPRTGPQDFPRPPRP